MVPVEARSSAAEPPGKPASTSPAARKHGESTSKNNLMALLLTGRCGEQRQKFHGTEHEQGEPPKGSGGSPDVTSIPRTRPVYWLGELDLILLLLYFTLQPTARVSSIG